MNKKVAIILVNYRDYAQKYLAECMGSIMKQSCLKRDSSLPRRAGVAQNDKERKEMKIFIVDNESTEKSYAYLKKTAPEAEIIKNIKNDGFAKGNNDAIKLALGRGFNYIILFNMDTVVDEDCVMKMVETAEIQPPSPPLSGGQVTLSEGEVGAVQARLMLYNEKDKINSLGNVTHFLGFGYSSNYLTPYSPLLPPRLAESETGIRRGDRGEVDAEICYPSGAAVLFKREVLEEVGLFDEKFWMYSEDLDLGWRIWLAGFRCVLAPEAVVYHKYEFSRSIKKYYFMDRNRILAILKNYHWLSLLIILPAFIVMEFGLLFFAYRSGWLKEKLKVYQYFFKLDKWRYILRARHETQKLRKIKDRDIVKMFSGEIWYQEIGNRKLKLANLLFNAYWQIARFLIRW